MILIVGDKPSRFNKDPRIAFFGARCEPRLQGWLVKLGIAECKIINRTDEDFEYYREQARIHSWKVIALGVNASKALKGVGHFIMPHPSGLNRQINNKHFIDKRIAACRKYLFVSF